MKPSTSITCTVCLKGALSRKKILRFGGAGVGIGIILFFIALPSLCFALSDLVDYYQQDEDSFEIIERLLYLKVLASLLGASLGLFMCQNRMVLKCSSPLCGSIRDAN